MRAIFKDNRIFIYDSFIHKESIKQITGQLWHPDDKAWSVPIGAASLETLDLLGCELSSELRAMRQKLIVSEESGDSIPIMSMPIKVTPYAHQIKAYNFACKIMELAGGDVDGS